MGGRADDVDDLAKHGRLLRADRRRHARIILVPSQMNRLGAQRHGNARFLGGPVLPVRHHSGLFEARLKLNPRRWQSLKIA